MLRRTAIVTGSARGIGKAIAQRLVQDGYSVCVNDIPSSATEIHSVVDELNNLPHPPPTTTTTQTSTPPPSPRPRAIGIPADVTSPDAVSTLIQETVHQLGPLTLMIANAGIAQVKPLLSCTPADIDRVFSVNFTGVFNCYVAAARQMIAQGDPHAAAGVGVYKILGAASIVAHKPFATLGIYSASKFAVRGLTQAFAMEMAGHQITVNAYAPGIVDTNMWEEIDAGLGAIQGRGKGESLRLYSDRNVALGRTSRPEDVAGLVGGFLASEDSDYVTGQTMVVDGGVVFT
ncbi:uncharacterized protein LDX57_012804 [Aspergillus melleus]|uniref:uncharacterized protein n=1 Tax=Aspergillus melleus TaxID=138277 RepID=UPI001E8D2B47|nr:uncharacterized protein LDX57_012804 [Aspergillus melleus]KAH8435175.1 hypothetical protein LDX57_012804 [Aspergillus melleus]